MEGEGKKVAERVVGLQVFGFDAVFCFFLLVGKLEQLHTIIHCRCVDMTVAVTPHTVVARDRKCETYF